MHCGACREFYYQLDEANENMEILVDYEKRETITLKELIPNWWGKERYGCRSCHNTAKCIMSDSTVIENIMNEYDAADIVVSVSPSYWADIPEQFKAFIDRCTPWCNTHEPHASIRPGNKGYAIALRTGPNMPECEKIIGCIEQFMAIWK